MEPADLPAGVLSAAAPLPGGRELPTHRRYLLQEGGRFAEVMRRVEARGLPDRSLAELWLWLVHIVINDGCRAATTAQSYGRTTARFLQWAADGGVDFTAATIGDFDRWQRWLAVECKNRENWRAQQVQALRNFFDWRRSRGLAETNLASELQGPKVKPKPPRKYTDDQLRGLFRSIALAKPIKAKRDLAIVLLLLSTGARREEITTLTLDQFELQRRVGVVRFFGKGAKEREVPFEGPVVAALQSWLETREALPFEFDASALFVGLTGPTRGNALSMRSYEDVLARHARAAKLRDWGIHRFRVTYATQLYDDGADIETIRALMGHESIETTRRYLAVSERARRTRLSADRQHRVLGTKPTGVPLWARRMHGGFDD